jgi:hypothetical protein
LARLRDELTMKEKVPDWQASELLQIKDKKRREGSCGARAGQIPENSGQLARLHAHIIATAV